MYRLSAGIVLLILLAGTVSAYPSLGITSLLAEPELTIVERDTIIIGEPVVWHELRIGSHGPYTRSFETAPIVKTREVREEQVNATHSQYDLTITFSTEHADGYTDVPVEISLPFLPNLTADGNTAFHLEERDGEYVLSLVIPEIIDERTLRLSLVRKGASTISPFSTPTYLDVPVLRELRAF